MACQIFSVARRMAGFIICGIHGRSDWLSRIPASAIGWEGEATGPVTRVGRNLSLSRLAPGEYELALEVRGPDGSRSTARRRIRITA